MKELIIYKSVYGSTKEYAEYVKKNIPNADMYNIDDLRPERLKEFGIVIIGSRTYMGSIQALKFIKDNWDVLKTKKVFLFAVGIFLPNEKRSEDSYFQIPPEIRNSIEYIKVPGRIPANKISMFDKMVVKVVNPPKLDMMDVKTLDPMIEKIKEIK